jgi:hypothetical protein
VGSPLVQVCTTVLRTEEDANHAQGKKVMTQEGQLLDYSPPKFQN